MKELWSAIQLTCRNLSMPMTWFHFIFIWFYEFHGNKMFYKVFIDFITCPFKPYTGKLQSWKSRIWHVNNLSVNTNTCTCYMSLQNLYHPCIQIFRLYYKKDWFEFVLSPHKYLHETYILNREFKSQHLQSACY